MLDRRFFERINTKQNKVSLFESYKAVHTRSTMVLFSRKTRTPLAALTLGAEDLGCLSMLTGRPSPKVSMASAAAPADPHFQGMLSMPNQTFAFTITNLSDRGTINFNVLHTPHRVSTVDPGPSYGINEVNELRANESYTIEADQRNNRKMILKGKTKTVVDPQTSKEKEVALTVDESEAKSEPKGLYFYLSVVPDAACKSLVGKYSEGTIWKVAPGFVRVLPRPSLPMPRRHQQYGSLPEEMPDWRSSARSLDDIGRALPGPAPPRGRFWASSASARTPIASASCQGGYAAHDRSGMTHMPSHRAQQFLGFAGAEENELAIRPPHAAVAPRAHVRSSSRDHSLSLSSGSSSSSDGFHSSASDVGLQSRYGGGASAGGNHGRGGSFQRIAPPAGTTHEKRAARDRSAGSFRSRMKKKAGRMCRQLPSAPMPASMSWDEAPRSSSCFAAEVDVGTTQAGELEYGRHVDVHSHATGKEYAYEAASEPTVLCMSIWEGMKFLPLDNRAIEEQLADEMEEWMKNEGKALIESLNAVFKNDTCVIDMESEADTIVCSCGHQCLNHANVGSLRKCPLCRSPITAFVRADGIVVE